MSATAGTVREQVPARDANPLAAGFDTRARHGPMTNPQLVPLPPVIHAPRLCPRHRAMVDVLHARLTGAAVEHALTPLHMMVVAFLVHLAIQEAGLANDRTLTEAEVHQLHASMQGWGASLCCHLQPRQWEAVLVLAALHGRPQMLQACRQ